MKLALLAPKYFVLLGKIDQAVAPFAPGWLPSGDCNSRHSNVAPCPCGSRLMPRCFSYQSYKYSGLSDLKKIPPMPVTRFMSESPRQVFFQTRIVEPICWDQATAELHDGVMQARFMPFPMPFMILAAR